MRARLDAALLAGAVTSISLVLAAGAASATPPGQPVGGPLLGSRGVVVEPLLGAPPLPAPSQLPASSWLVADLDTGQVLAAKNAHGRFLPASTLKTLTAVTLLPKLPAGQVVRATDADARVDGSRVGLMPGHSYTVSQLFTSMLVVSANDAANALAGAAGGTRATLTAMNSEAQHLQAFDTLARTPSGLDGAGESSSAYDLALIARAGFQMPAFRHYLQIVKSRMPAAHHKHFQIYTHNYLLTTFPGDLGGKNGYTDAARGTYVGVARRGGHTIVVSLMHANPDFWPMARSLLSWGFHADGRVTPVGTLVGPQQPQPVSAATAVPPVQLAAPRRGRHTSPLDIAVVAVTAVVAAATVVRRGRARSRRRPQKLRLPRAY